MGPLTGDERERRFVQYCSTLNKGQLAEVRLRRLGQIANFRKELMQLLEEMIEARAEDLAAAMLMEYAAPRPKREITKREKLAERKRTMPVWIREQGQAAAALTIAPRRRSGV